MNSCGCTPIIFPLRGKLFNSGIMFQQRPRYTGWRQVVQLPNLPLDDVVRPSIGNYNLYNRPPMTGETLPVNYGLCAAKLLNIPLSSVKQNPIPRAFFEQRFMPSVVHSIKPMPATFFTISGQTRDNVGAVSGNCTVHLFDTNFDIFRELITSNSDGYFYFKSPVRGTNYYLVAYKIGSPDIAGTTKNTITV